MTEKFEATIIPIKHYTKYKSSDYTLAVIQFDIVKDGVKFDNGYNGRYECCDIGLKEIVETADDFLSGKITQNDRLSFEIPYIVGGYIRYGYFFDINVEDCDQEHWVFQITPNFTAEKREITYSCILDKGQVKNLRDSIAHQIETFDWENCGKTDYLRLGLPERDYQWCYSAKQLERQLNDSLTGQSIHALYVSGTNFASPLMVEENFVNYYVGSRIYLELDSIHVDLLACASGLFKIRTFKKSEVEMISYHDEIEDADEILCDTDYVFSLDYKNESITGICIEETDCWPWNPRNFDESKLGDPIELPDKLFFQLANHTIIEIGGWDDDFYIRMKTEQ